MTARSRQAKDLTASVLFRGLTIGAAILLAPLAAGLLWKSWPVLSTHRLDSILLSLDWAPRSGRFGMLPFLAGTIYVTALATVVAVPVSLLSAIYLTEYAPRAVRAAVLPMVDLLSGIPSVVYGVFGALVIVPAVARLADLMGAYSSGYSLLAGALVLALMACPFILGVSREVLDTVPRGLREASLSLGATRWQTVKRVVLRKARRGIVAAVVLGIARALGETIAVLMVVGNVAAIPRSLFDPAYPLPALLANDYGEMMSIPLYDSVLMLSALILLAVVLALNTMARLAATAVQREAA